MSRIKSFLLLVCVVVAQLFVGCEQLEQAPEGEAIVKLDVYELNVSGGGGDIPIFYGVENPRPGARPQVTCSEEWVAVKEVTSSMIMLTVAPSNVSEERFCFVTITYEGMVKPIKVPILQDAQELNYFSFEVSDVTHNSCTVKYIPQQCGVMFMANIIDSAYFTQSGIYEMDQFIDAEMANYLNIAAQHEMTLEYLLTEAISPQVLFTEETTRSFANMQPGATYVVYAYGVELDGDSYNVTIPCHTLSVTLPNAQYYDVTFMVSPQVGSMGSASVTITPKNWSGYYAVSIIPDTSVYYVPKGDRMSENTLKAMGNEFYKRARQAVLSGTSVEAFLKGSCFSGSAMFNVSLSGGSKYMVAVYAVESVNGAIPVMCSAPTIAYF